MNGSNNQLVPQSHQGLIFQPGTQIPQNARASGIQVWSQSDSLANSHGTDASSTLLQLPPQTILMTNIQNASVGQSIVRNPPPVASMQQPGTSSPLIFASPNGDGTSLIRAPFVAPLSSQLANTLSNGPPRTSFIPSLINSSIPSPANINLQSSQNTNNMFNGVINGLTATSLQQSSQMPKVISIAAISTAQLADLTSISGSSTQATYSNPVIINSHSTYPGTPSVMFTSRSLIDIVKETDPDLQLDEETEETLLSLSQEFVEAVTDKAIKLAQHRGGSSVEPRDVKFCLDRDWNISVPGFPIHEKSWKRPFVLQAHKQRLDLIKKQLKRF